MLLNSTLQPIGELTGGGLNRIVCQFVDWIFSKWSIEAESSCSIVSPNWTRGSRINRWAMCEAILSSRPASQPNSTHLFNQNKRELRVTYHYRSDDVGHCRPSARRYRDILACFAHHSKCTDRPNHIGTWVYGIGHSSVASKYVRQKYQLVSERLGPTFKPRSSSVLSSTLAAITFHLASTSAKKPLKAGLAAVKAS